MEKETEQKIKTLQMLEQNLQSFLTQKQQLQTQLIEINSATKELENTKEAYHVIGNLMVKKSPEDLKKEVEDRKEVIDLKMKSVEKQESLIKEKSKKLQEEIMENMNKGD